MDDNQLHESQQQTSGSFDAGSSYTPNIQPKDYGNGFGVASLVCGIASLVLLCCCAPITGVLAIVFGIVQITRTPNNKGMSIAGIITGAIGILLSLIILIIFMVGVTPDRDMTDLNQFYQEFYNELGNDI